MGFSTMALIGIKVEGNRLNDVVDKIAAFEEVVYMVLLTGSYDLSVEVVCRDNDHLLNFLMEKLHAVKGIRDTETFVYLQIAKETYTWAGKMR
jgi:Lrp/AsnC family transcriptional regulator for asnA, asnC and gidA